MNTRIAAIAVRSDLADKVQEIIDKAVASWEEWCDQEKYENWPAGEFREIDAPDGWCAWSECESNHDGGGCYTLQERGSLSALLTESGFTDFIPVVKREGDFSKTSEYDIDDAIESAGVL